MTDAKNHPHPPRTPPASDESLFLAYCAGDQAALRTLIERYHDDLLRFLYRMTSDRQAAEDLFQEAFLQAHLSSRTFDPTRRFRPWLFTIAANKARDYLRKRNRRAAQELSAPVRGSDDQATSYVDLLSLDLPGPDERLTEEERDQQVQHAIDRLSPMLREVLLLAYFQRLSYAQIAEELQIPLGTVKSRLHAAVASFARAWKDVTSPDPSEDRSR